MTGPTNGWTTVASVDLLVSLRVPIGWQLTAPDADTLRLQRDAADESDYRATATLSQGRPEQPGHEWFAAFADAVPGQLATEVPAFDLIGTDRFVLSSHADVVAVRARQHAGGLPPTSQLQAWVWINSYRMLTFGASTLSTHEQRDLPDFDTMLRSLRVLPRRPE
jgi:hypothetical protein